MPAATNLLGRALALLAPDDRLRAPLTIDLVDALREQGEFERVAQSPMTGRRWPVGSAIGASS
ncbi:MAG: hypothetical protein ACRDG8_08980 [Actinomycetota bacterium]